MPIWLPYLNRNLQTPPRRRDHVGKAEFAENSEFNSEFLPTSTLRPVLCGGSAGEIKDSGENVSAS